MEIPHYALCRGNIIAGNVHYLGWVHPITYISVSRIFVHTSMVTLRN